MIAARRYKVGELRPSQMLYSFGIGAIIDLPRLSGLIMGLDDWDVGYAKEIGEERLLSGVRAQEGLENVKRLLAAPTPPEGEDGFVNPVDAVVVGIPVAPFPRWMLCPFCRLLAPLESGLFKLKVDRFRADRTGYVHENCPNTKKPPFAVPSRFMVACPKGHLDDFPWKLFVHKGPSDCNGILRLRHSGISGEVTDVYVLCEGCGALRQMTAAFGRDGRAALPECRALAAPARLRRGRVQRAIAHHPAGRVE